MRYTRCNIPHKLSPEVMLLANNVIRELDTLSSLLLPTVGNKIPGLNNQSINLAKVWRLPIVSMSHQAAIVL